jgi:hypothetical protein
MSTRFILLLGLVCFSVSDVAGQGRFSFQNSGATLVLHWYTDVRADSNTKVAMYYNLNTNVTSTWEWYTNVPRHLPQGGWGSGWVLNTNAVTNVSTLLPGYFLGGVRTVPGVPGGTTIAVCIRAWSPPYPTWEAQDATWNCDPHPRGESRVFLLTLAASNGPPSSLVSAGLDEIRIGPHLGPRLCAPLLRMQRDGSNVILHITATNPKDYGPDGWGNFVIESNSGFASNGWQVRATMLAQTNVTWVDPLGPGSGRFYRVWNSSYP